MGKHGQVVLTKEHWNLYGSTGPYLGVGSSQVANEVLIMK